MPEPQSEIIWTDYVRYRARLRGFDLAKIEPIVRYSSERYLDTETERSVVIGRIEDVLVMIPYETEQTAMIPVTIHATTRQQVNFRLKTGRFSNE